ncbi:MAG: hypothetical protein PHZ09_08275 [Eubacteriales bacterium]|nr:hypothetical protein [Eubacteriales bacterium]
MKRFISILVCAAIVCAFSAISINALNIYDGYGNVVGTSVLTSSSMGRVYTLKVTDNVGSDAYAAIYLYDGNGNLIDGGWDGYKQYVELVKGNASIAVTYKTIRSSVQGYPYVYYEEYP